MNFKTLAVALLSLAAVSLPVVADDLDDIKKRGMLTVGVKDATPPFGVLDPKTRSYTGYDVDFAIAIAKHMGVKLQAKAVESAERENKLMGKDVDLIIATMTKTPDREKKIDFSEGYFVTGQKFVVRKGKVKNLEDLTRSTIGTVKGSTSEKGLRREMPNAKVVLFDDYDIAFHALGQGQLDAVSTDEPILAGQLSKMANKAQFEIPDVSISIEVYGVGIRKGEKRLQKEVNDTLVAMEQSGEAQRIFDKWFGPQSSNPMMRTFKITLH